LVFDGGIEVEAGRDAAQARTRLLPDISGGSFNGGALAMGDIDADGLNDLVVCDPQFFMSDAEYAGRCWLFYGPLPEGDVPMTDAAATFVSGAGYGWFGYSVQVADFNGDGLQDVIVGAPTVAIDHVPHAGRVFVFEAPFEAVEDIEQAEWGLTTGQLSDAGGWALAAEDLDGDGKAELMIGAPSDNEGDILAGKVYVPSHDALPAEDR
jgi:hypothetical protein